MTEPKSHEAEDYQHVSRDLSGMPRDQSAGSYNAPHHHIRGQLLYAVSGLMKVKTEHGLWLVPPNKALWIPPGIVHDQLMMTSVKMRTLYVAPDKCAAMGDICRLVEVSVLLRELIVAFILEPIEYDLDGKGMLLAGLILLEMAVAATVPLAIPWPRDRRLLVVCNAILAHPDQPRTIEYWANEVGASSRTLIRLFVNETKLTFRQWVQQVHLAEALDRLERGEALGKVADALGYASPSAFTALFRKVMGESPRDYLARK
ncbi:AraC family transcriptional regulator [Pseudomonas frederiksbergensis]|uniref:AraC family transcriptional regulator n=1 Tax=Pseudomonas frederiksbergensis TaxID=104087 RepID=UPI003D1C4F51